MGGKLKEIVKTALVVAAVATGIAFIPGIGAIATGAFTGTTLAYFGGQFLLSAVLGAVGSALADAPAFPSASELTGRTVTQRNPIASRKIVYGRVRLGGTIINLESGVATGDKDLHAVVAIAGHEVNAFKKVYFNDVVVKENLSDAVRVSPDSGTTPDYSAVGKITAHFGKTDQVADSDLVAETVLTSSDRGRGIAYIYVKNTFDQDVYSNGLPNVSVEIEGKKVFDPRTSTTAYSNNAALCIRDFLQNTIGATNDEIDDTAFTTAANVSDENVTLVGGGTEKRYTINGVVDTANKPSDILAQMVTACAGMLYFANGKWKLKVGQYITPTDTLTLDDLRGPIKVDTRLSAQSQFNAVKGIFVSPENNWQATDFPEVTSAVFAAEDGGDTKYIDYTLPFTTSSSTAQRLAKQALYRSREQITLTLPCKLSAFKYEIGDTVMFTHERYGWTSKVFEVISWTLAPDISEKNASLGVDLVLKETSANVYAWDETVDEKEFTYNNTTLPSAFEDPAPALAVSDELRTLNEEAISVLVANVSGGGAFLKRYEVEALKAGDTEYVNIGEASGNRFELLNVEDNAVYTVRARTINTLGVRSAWATAAHQVVGKTAPPSDVTGLTGNVIGNQYLLTWNPVPDLDLSHYRVRFAAEDGALTYQNSVSLVPKVSRPATSVLVPARNGTYFVKAVDKLGLASETPASIALSTNINDIESLNVVQTINEHPDFNGTFDDVVEIDEEDRLVLNTDLNFDAVAGNFDDALGLFDGGSGNIDADGYYYFANSVDLGAVYTSRVTATLKSVRVDYVNLFDSASGLFDDRVGVFDGDVNAFDDTDAEMQVRFTDDDPAGSPTWSSWQTFQVSDIKARAMEFRCKMTTTDDQATPAVSHLSVVVDMPDRVDGADDVVSGAGSKTVTYSPAFKKKPSLGLTVHDMQTGDFYEITNPSATSFTITFKNSGGTPISRKFDWVAKGYGKEVA